MLKRSYESIIKNALAMLPGATFRTDYEEQENLLTITVFYKGFRDKSLYQRFEFLANHFGQYARQILEDYSVAFEAWLDVDDLAKHSGD